jgi:hypothetical protein
MSATRRRGISPGLLAAAIAALAVAPHQAVTAPDPAVWIGSPINGRWTDAVDCVRVDYPTPKCSVPTVHHTPFLGRNAWAVDLQVAEKNSVILFAAPNDTRLNNRIQARILAAGPACASGRVSDGGSRVVVGVYLDKKVLIGQVAYAHIDLASGIAKDKWMPRWNTKLGTVGSYSRTSCWGGVHHHLEMVSTKGYACFNKGYKASTDPRKSTAMKQTNFVGFIGGSYSGPRKSCP